MIWFLVTIAILAGLGFSALFSGAETGLYCANRVRLHLRVQQNDHQARRVSRLLENAQAGLGLTLVGTNVSNYVVTTAVAYLFADLIGISEAHTELYTVVLLTPVVFVFGEVVPKSLFQRHANLLLLRFSAILAVSHVVLRATGVLACVTKLGNLAARLGGGGWSAYSGFEPKQRVAMLLQEALAADGAGEDQSYLVNRVVQLSETPVHAVMVPQNRVRTVSSRADRRELGRIARRTDHARLPVHGARHRIIGMVDVDDLLAMDHFDAVGDHLLPVVTLSPHATVAEAISRIQVTGVHTVIVTDRGGRMLGLITLKGLLGEVLGELATSVETGQLWA